jgi:pyruvate/2-oxoglutarate dehydrogenase complex dihydrolipoamide acyltransferase (E2) component
LGTFGVTSYSGLGAESLHPLSPLTATLNYGVIGHNGSVDVRIIYDHRVMDGATVARALARMEEVLNEGLVGELRSSRLAAA